MARKPKPRTPTRKGPKRDEIEELFWRGGLDLLVDGKRLFLGAEFFEMLDHDGKLERLPRGRYRLILEGQAFRLGPYKEECDGHSVRWEGRARDRASSSAGKAKASPKPGGGSL